jgi:acyl-CoA thioesterase I
MRGVIVAMRLVGLALSLAVLLVAPADAAPNSKSCAAPHELRQLRGGLARTATRLARQEPLTIVAIGSSSTFGYGASSLALSYPSQLAVELRRRIPAETIEVRNEGVSGETSIEMLERFDRDVFAHQPDLVIWQVGTNAVLHDFEIGHYRQVVRDGVERLKNAGIDVIIMDMQFAPKVLAHPLYREMERNLAELAKEEGVPVFRRFALMRNWVESGQLDFATMLSPDGLHMNDLTYGCISRILADAIIERTEAPVIISRPELIPERFRPPKGAPS